MVKPKCRADKRAVTLVKEAGAGGGKEAEISTIGSFVTHPVTSSLNITAPNLACFQPSL